MNILITLLIAHLFADFPLQSNILAKLKEKYWSGVLLHVLIHLLVMGLLISNSPTYWALIVGIGIVHFIIDGLKLLCPAKKGIAYFLVDQLLHLTTLGVAAYIAQQVWRPAPVSLLPEEWLLPILSGALIPALMVLLWIWTNGLSQEDLSQFSLLTWIKEQMLTLEQRIGVLLFLFVCLRPSIYFFVGMLENVWR